MAISEPCTASALVTVATAVAISTSSSLLTAITLNPGSAASSVIVYDAASGTGNVLGQLLGVANGSSVSLAFESPVYASRGLTVTVAGTAATAQLHFIKSD